MFLLKITVKNKLIIGLCGLLIMMIDRIPSPNIK